MKNRIEVVDGALLRIVGPEDAPTLMLLAGFPDSGYLFETLFSTELSMRYRLITIDLWGFGASPRRNDSKTVNDYGISLAALIKDYVPDQRVGLVGHSIAAPIWVETASELGEKIIGLFSIEGNLTPEDAFFTGKAANFDDPFEFKQNFLEQVWELGQDSETMRRYYSGAAVADAVAMWNLGRDAKNISEDGEPGRSFKEMIQPSLYYWSKESTPVTTKKWIEDSGIKNQLYAEAGHWPTIDQPENTARAIAEFFDEILI